MIQSLRSRKMTAKHVNACYLAQTAKSLHGQMESGKIDQNFCQSLLLIVSSLSEGLLMSIIIAV